MMGGVDPFRKGTFFSGITFQERPQRTPLTSSLPFVPEKSRPMAAKVGDLLINVTDSVTVSANASALVSAVTPTGVEYTVTVKKTK